MQTKETKMQKPSMNEICVLRVKRVDNRMLFWVKSLSPIMVKMMRNDTLTTSNTRKCKGTRSSYMTVRLFKMVMHCQ